nr:type II secretion system secretin GspD [uncultured Roseateles sp.]
MKHCPTSPLRQARQLLARAVAASLLCQSTGLLAQTPPADTPSRKSSGTSTPRPLSPALKSRTPVTLNFVNTDIEAVTRAIGVMIDRQFIVDPRVKGTITVYSEQPLTVREAYLNYLAALRGLGFTVVENTGLLKVVPEADAKLQAGSVVIGTETAPRGDQIITQIFKLNYENANNLVAVLRPLISPNNTINANPGNNSLVITDYAENLQRLARIVAAMDNPGATDMEVVPLKHAIASDLAALVLKLSDGGAAAAVPGAIGTSVSVLADSRSNSLILRAPNPARLAATRAIIEKLDRPMGDDAAGNIRVVYLKNADAVKLATVLRAAYGASSSGSSGGGSGSSSVGGAGGVLPGVLTGAANSGIGGSAGASASTTPVSASQGPSTGGFVQADPATNSLIITAPEPMYRQLRAVIDQLDARRAQVYVESMIVKVNADKAATFGVQWQNLFGDKGDSSIVGAGTNFNSGNANILNQTVAVAQGRAGVATALASAAPGGLNIGILKKVGGFYTLGAVANFLESQTGANILSTPNLVALDNEEAKIVIGQNVPFITGSFTNTGGTTGATNPFQTIERKDVGLTLRIKSQIGEGGTVRMTVYQENSSVVPGATNSAGPTTDKSSIETTVVVDDGSILVLGGLLKDEYTDGEDRVPGLASIPLVGNLFRSENRKRVKSNLMVFLRPVVMRTQQSADELTLSRYESIRALQQTNQPQPSRLLPINESPVLPQAPGTAPATTAPAKREP